MSNVDIDLIIGGPQGGGIDSAAQIIIRSFSIAGYEAYGIREYHSNIKGRHSYFHVRIKDDLVRSLRYPVDVLACLDAETPFVHMNDITENTLVLFDQDLRNTKLAQVLTMEGETKKHIEERLVKEGCELTVNGALECMKRSGAKLVPVSFRDLVIKALGPNKPPARYANTLGASISMALMGLDSEFTRSGIESVFGKKKEVLEDNEKIVKVAYDFVEKNDGISVKKLGAKVTKERYILTGNEAIAIGKVIGGLKLQTYYPITPAADESFFLEGHDYFEEVIAGENESLSKSGVVIVQAEDEIAAIAMAISGAMTGARTATGTSGPGFSLMAEAIGYAGINEIPVVVSLYQRGGPSTGLPTRNSQADLLFAVHAGHGDFPKLVLSSGDVNEGIEDAVKAFNYAEMFQMPVIHILDKNFANSFYVIDGIDYSKMKIKRWKLHEKNDEEYERFKFTEDGISPMSFFGKDIMWLTGDEHNEFGHITEDPETRDKMMEKRMHKLEVAKNTIPMEDQAILFGEKDADVTLVSWGSNKGLLLDMLDKLKSEGVRANFLYIRLMAPFPSEFVLNVLKNSKLIIDVESNYTGQLAQLIEQNCGFRIDNYLLKYNGRHQTLDETYDGIKSIMKGESKRVVLRNGA
ncbi:MAG: 2-oxoacid:acceptor oxidoreductase subunit alpha [Candidatus Thermoplasmatota archaeon]|jgi:2-oxoglutarate ferredoxin oxidoreductase subunit alpha|nr:2-oxoacid:acceptor oxidoreductase subunit alpha [Candidatus Thermoplasmatota archaeon]